MATIRLAIRQMLPDAYARAVEGADSQPGIYAVANLVPTSVGYYAGRGGFTVRPMSSLYVASGFMQNAMYDSSSGVIHLAAGRPTAGVGAVNFYTGTYGTAAPAGWTAVTGGPFAVGLWRGTMFGARAVWGGGAGNLVHVLAGAASTVANVRPKFIAAFDNRIFGLGFSGHSAILTGLPDPDPQLLWCSATDDLTTWGSPLANPGRRTNYWPRRQPPGDGTGLAATGEYLAIFKERSVEIARPSGVADLQFFVVSSLGTRFPDSLVTVGSDIYYWGIHGGPALLREGQQTIDLGPALNSFLSRSQELEEDAFASYGGFGVDASSTARVIGGFDASTGNVYWVYNSSVGSVASTRRNAAIVYNIYSQSFSGVRFNYLWQHSTGYRYLPWVALPVTVTPGALGKTPSVSNADVDVVRNSGVALILDTAEADVAYPSTPPWPHGNAILTPTAWLNSSYSQIGSDPWGWPDPAVIATSWINTAYMPITGIRLPGTRPLAYDASVIVRTLAEDGTVNQQAPIPLGSTSKGWWTIATPSSRAYQLILQLNTSGTSKSAPVLLPSELSFMEIRYAP